MQRDGTAPQALHHDADPAPGRPWLVPVLLVGVGAAAVVTGTAWLIIDEDPVTRSNVIVSENYRDTGTQGALTLAAGVVVGGVGGFLWWRASRAAPTLRTTGGGGSSRHVRVVLTRGLMTTASSSLAFAALIAGFSACNNKHDPNYCPDHPYDNCLNDAADAQMMCSGDLDCSTPAPVCDLSGSRTCVQCTTTEASACVAQTPVCGDDKTCRACKAHVECSSATCLPDGSCAAESSVAYVAPAGSGSACTKASPCGTLDDALKTNKPNVKIAVGVIKDNKVTTIDGRMVRILAEQGGTLDRDGDGPILEVKSANADVELYDLTISGASGIAGADGIDVTPNGGTPKLTAMHVTVTNNQGTGVAVSGGMVVVSRSTISSNTGGGIVVSNGVFTIVGNVLFGNGTQSGSVGGISITTSQNPTNRLEFNSLNRNQTQNGLGSAIQCVAGTFTARNNIMSGNGTLTNMEQTGGTCTHGYSIAQPGTLPSGTGNSAADPMFANTTTGDLHIATSSPGRRAADPASDVSGAAARDIDGDVRAQPADIGADQVP